MSPDRKRRYIADLVPADTRDAKLVDVRFCDNTARAYGSDKPFIVTIREITFCEPCSKADKYGPVAWSVSRKSIDLYNGGGTTCVTLAEARAVFEQHIAASGEEASLF